MTQTLKTLIVDLLQDKRLKRADSLSEEDVLLHVPEQIRCQQVTTNRIRRAFRELERAGLAKRAVNGYRFNSMK